MYHGRGIVTQEYFQAFPSRGMRATITTTMFKSIGVILILWYLSHLFTSSFAHLDRALSATFETMEAAAVASRGQFVE